MLRVTSNLDQLINFLWGAGEDLYAINKTIGLKHQQLMKELEAFASEDMTLFNTMYNKKMATYLLEQFDSIAVSNDDQVFGIKDNQQTLLFKGSEHTFKEAMGFGDKKTLKN